MRQRHHVTYKHIAAALVAAILAAGCSDATLPPPRILNGQYGGDGIGLDVTTNRTTLTFDCAFGEIDGPIALRSDGTFDVPGTFTGAGNAVNADHTPHPVRYAGHASREVVRLTIVAPGFGNDTAVAVVNAQRFVAAC